MSTLMYFVFEGDLTKLGDKKLIRAWPTSEEANNAAKKYCEENHEAKVTVLKFSCSFYSEITVDTYYNYAPPGSVPSPKPNFVIPNPDYEEGN